MQYGFFDDARREYVITRPDTPKPWANYLGSAEFGGVITNHGAGYTFYRSAAQGRLTRFLFNAPPAHLPGRYVYLHDGETGDYWALGWMPVPKPLDEFRYECRHGTGYTIIRSEYRGISAEATWFIPLRATCEVWCLRFCNTDSVRRTVAIFPYVEPQCNWSADDDTRNLQYNQYIAQTKRVGTFIDIGSNVNMPEDPEHFTNKDQKRHTFFGLVGIKPDGFDADREAFLGTWGTYARPFAVAERGATSGATAYGDMPAAAFEIRRTLAPGESLEFAVLFGVGQAETAGVQAAQQLSDTARREAALEAVRQHWHSRMQALEAHTPDAEFNSMVNTWSPYNNLMTFYWSRSASLVYTGERDGLGYRDTVQDLVGTAALIPDETRERLELMLTGQYSNGGCKPVVQPFNHHPGAEAMPDGFRSDDGLWLFNAVPTYVKETGDLSFYRKVLPFADRGEASVLGHLRRAMEFNLERRGAHGLPCGLQADWNDCLRLGERGESVFVAMQLRFALREYIDICQRLGEEQEAQWARERLEEVDNAIAEHAWDGEWYLAAFRYDGTKIGSSENDEGSIYMYSQAWAVLSGHATGERASRAMEAMHQHLFTEYGIMLCTPPYVHTEPHVCVARLFNPGCKENASIFNHTQGWAVLASAALGWGERAYQYSRAVLPARFNTIAEVRQVEPYVVCQSTHSVHSPRFGAGRISWLSGSAVWNYVAMTTGILGIRAEYDGLRVDPCVPRNWRSFRIQRRFRGALYHIHVENPEGVEHGVKEVWYNGQRLESNLLPIAAPGSEVSVTVRMGTAA